MMSVSEKIEVAGYYSNDSEIELRGTDTGLKALVDVLESTLDQECLDKILTKPEGTTWPYDGCLKQITVCDADGTHLRIWREGDLLFLNGSKQARRGLAANLRWLTSTGGGTGSHLHIEGHPEHPFLDPSSAPMVVSIVESLDSTEVNSP